MNETIPLERMRPDEIERLKIRHTNRDGSAEVLTSKAWAHITLQDATIARLEAEVDTFTAAVDYLTADYTRCCTEKEALKAEVERTKRHARHGENLFNLAISLGWVDGDDEGPINFVMRRTREVALEDARLSHTGED